MTNTRPMATRRTQPETKVQRQPSPGSLTTQAAAIDPGPVRLHRFHGGITVNDHKAMSTDRPLITAGIPKQLIVPLAQHIGVAAKPLVKVGDHVSKGHRIARSPDYIGAHLHAPTSGTVVAIADHPIAHPSGLSAPAIMIETDGQDRWIDDGHPDGLGALPNWRQLDAHAIRTRVRAAGIVGLGGAAFPTAVKLNRRGGQIIERLIVNGAECEPYISADDTLMRNRPKAILEGAAIACHVLQAARIVVAVEDNKPAAIAALTDAAADLDPAFDVAPIEIVSIPSVYPSGGERQLIQILTGREVPSGKLPADIGCVVHNPGTLAAIREAVLHGHPLVSRVVTLTGGGLNTPCNVEALLGTPVEYLIEKYAGGYAEGIDRLVMGGPMMGFTLCCDDVPVTKGMNCLLATRPTDRGVEFSASPCIRCGDCVTVCPARLLPQQLYWAARADDLDSAESLGLFDCIECGCCAYVCPSHIPLVQYYRHAKTEVWHRERSQTKADLARVRFENRNERLAREAREKAERLARKKKMLAESKKSDTTRQDEIAAALARVKARKALATDESPIESPSMNPGGSETHTISDAKPASHRPIKNDLEARSASSEHDVPNREPSPKPAADETITSGRRPGANS